jgi:Beta-lactamase enzyme family
MPRTRITAILALIVCLGVGAGRASAVTAAPARAGRLCTVPGTGKPLDRLWRPDTRAAIAYARARGGDVSFAVRTAHRFYGFRPDHVVPSASVVKAMLMVAYLDQPSVRNRALNGFDFSLLIPMITQSDNNAATAVRNIVGNGALRALAARAYMTNFATNPIWGLTQVTARDQTKLFLHIDDFVAPLHRWYALHLLASIVPYERWGVGEVQPEGWKLYFKGGWGLGTGAVDHQVALLIRGCARVSVAVMTLNDGTHAYGKQTLRGMFARLLRGLPSGARRRRR